MYRLPRRGLIAAALLLEIPTFNRLMAEEGIVQLPPTVVTATRGELDISRSGSAIDIIDHDEIQRLGATSLRDVLQSAPGVYIHETGGPGSTTSATLRGSAPGQTLILVDGVRLSDPTSVDNGADLGPIAITDIERIEVLRGPQSALYGSEAMGGVIQIITRKGEGPPKKTVTIEGGSYGTLHSRASISGGADNVSYAFSVDALHSEGFARFGYRASRPIFLYDANFNLYPLPPTPGSDPTDRAGMTGRVSYKIDGTTELELGFAGNGTHLKIDNQFAAIAENVYSPFNQQTTMNGRVYSKFSNEVFEGRLRNQLTLFASAQDSVVAQTESCPDYVSDCRTNYRGVRVGGEYQGDLKLGPFGQLSFGFRNDTERSFLSIDQPANLGGHLGQFSKQLTINSAFALHQFTLGDQLNLSYAGRVDSAVGGPSFVTGRATAAWRLPSTGGKLRASIGTGAKIPSLYQSFGPYGASNLAPEESTGIDLGIDQPLFDERLSVSATIFQNKFTNLIDFKTDPIGCPTNPYNECYYNVNRATTQGAEVSTKIELVPNEWRAMASYTYLDAKNTTTMQRLQQRPRHKGVGALIYTGLAGLRLEGRITVVGGVLDFGNVLLPAYYRLDGYADYKINDSLSLFARLENIMDARYEEVRNYGVAGRSLYAGVRLDW